MTGHPYFLNTPCDLVGYIDLLFTANFLVTGPFTLLMLFAPGEEKLLMIITTTTLVVIIILVTIKCWTLRWIKVEVAAGFIVKI